MNNRKIGLRYVHEVKKILEKEGMIVEGPMYKPAFIKGRSIPVHSDFFGVFDLIAYNTMENEFTAHQISTDENKSTKIKNILAKNIIGFVWGRLHDDSGVILYRLYYVGKGMGERDYMFIKEYALTDFLKGKE